MVLAAATATPEVEFPEITLPVRIKGNWYTALVDCGAPRNYIRPEIVNALRLPWNNKTRPYQVDSVEGHPFLYEDGWVRRETDHLLFSTANTEMKASFDLVALGTIDLILGRPWLYQYNPSIDWRTREVKVSSPPVEGTNDSERSQPTTVKERQEETTETVPPKGTRHTHQKGHDRRIRKTIAFIRARLRLLDEKLKE